MHCNPVLTADEFKTIHNGLCDIDSVTQNLEGILKPELYQKLLRGVAEIRKGLTSAYEQDDREFKSRSDHYAQVGEELGLNNSVWSVYEVSNLNEAHPFSGITKVVYESHWGPRPVTVAVNGLTWAALYVAANACIRDSGDAHHVYIETFTPSKDDPSALILSTGS